jgi:hypothetical protein
LEFKNKVAATVRNKMEVDKENHLFSGEMPSAIYSSQSSLLKNISQCKHFTDNDSVYEINFSGFRSCGLVRDVMYYKTGTDISEEHAASIFKVDGIGQKALTKRMILNNS